VTAVLDAYAVLALLRDEPAADEVGALIKQGGCELTVTGVAEILDHLVRVVGASDDEASLDLAQLGLGDPIPLDVRSARRAGLLRARHHHRTHRAVSLADCIAAERARERRVPLATADPHLLGLCTDEQIAVVPLPDSGGRRWSP